MDENKNFWALPEKNKFETILSSVFFLGVIACILIISSTDLTSKESGILSLFLTVLSVIASWLLAKIYGDSQHAQAIEEVKDMHNEKIRTFALKAAEKVNNLSEQINKLSIYLEEALNDNYEDDRESRLAKEQRIESAIHILSMLKSVNDTSLSDWHGVIDEEIEEQREARVEREEELRTLVHRLESVILKVNKNQEDDQLSKQVEIMKKDMRTLMVGISGAHILSPKATKKKVRRDLVQECPKCQESLKYTQRAKINSVKTISCKGCNVLLYSKYFPDQDTFVLGIKEEKREEINCPECGMKITFELDTEKHTRKTIKCGQCHNEIKAIREANGDISAKGISHTITTSELSEQDIERVKNELPTQPWPKHIHKEIAQKLDMSNTAVIKATHKLIKRDTFKEQIDGVLYDSVDTQKDSLTKPRTKRQAVS